MQERDDSGDDAGQVLDALARGRVVGERYEIEEPIHADALGVEYRARDQESNAEVLLRVLRPELTPDRGEQEEVLREVRRRIAALRTGTTERLEADVDHGALFSAEAWPGGRSLREILRTRRARGGALSLEEVRPIAVGLAGELGAFPADAAHGELRAERVFIGAAGLRLTSPFLFAALRGARRASLLASDQALARALAPELAVDGPTPAADRYGVARILAEALRGPTPAGAAGPPAGSGPVWRALEALLAPDPGARPSSLDELVRSLAPAPSAPPRPLSAPPRPLSAPPRPLSAPPGEASSAARGRSTRPPRPPNPTMELDASDILEARAASGAAPTRGAPAAAPGARRRSRSDSTQPTAIVIPDGVQAVPAPRRTETDSATDDGPPLFDDSDRATAARPAVAGARQSDAAPTVRTTPAIGTEARRTPGATARPSAHAAVGTTAASRTLSTDERHQASRAAGAWIVAVSAVLAALIILAGLWFRLRIEGEGHGRARTTGAADHGGPLAPPR